MSTLITRVFHRASRCPFACFLKFLLLVGFIYTLHIAVSHQVDMSPYLFPFLVALVGLVAILAQAFHWQCQFSKGEEEGETN